MNEQHHAQQRQAEVTRLLATTQGILIRNAGEVSLCDTARYDRLIEGQELDVDRLNAALLASARSSPAPPELSTLLLTAKRDEDYHPILLLILFGALLLIAVSACLLWKDPLRILLLGPLADRRASRSLTKFVRRNIMGWGHVITLLDGDPSESIWTSVIHSLSPKRLIGHVLLIPLLPLVRLPALLITVRREQHLARLFAALNNRYNLNFFAIFDTIREVWATNALRQRALLFLMSNADVILVDVTMLKESSRWEIERLVEHGLLSKSIFVAEQSTQFVAPGLRPVFSYTKRGVVSGPDTFAEAVAGIIAQSA